MIEVKNLSKTYGNIEAIKNLNFSVKKGEVIGFLGPNGAGKTTTMKIITGFIPPSEGTVIIDDIDILENNIEVKKRIGYLPENLPLYNDMTVRSYLGFVAEIKGISRNGIKVRVSEVTKALGINDVENRMIKNLSKGYKQRVGLAQAIIGNPDVLILDEPTIGLDPNQIIDIRDLIKKLSADRTIILSTHILPEVSQLCDRVVIINKGQIVAIDTPQNLSKHLKESNVLEVRIVGESVQVMKSIKTIKGVTNVSIIGEKEQGAVDYKIEAEKDMDIRPELFKIMAENKYQIIELKTIDLSLEDVFLQLTASVVDTQENTNESEEQSKEAEEILEEEPIENKESEEK